MAIGVGTEVKKEVGQTWDGNRRYAFGTVTNVFADSNQAVVLWTSRKGAKKKYPGAARVSIEPLSKLMTRHRIISTAAAS